MACHSAIGPSLNGLVSAGDAGGGIYHLTELSGLIDHRATHRRAAKGNESRWRVSTNR
jgi:hypothetical protein